MSTVVGIDLGTTYSAIAYVDDKGWPQVIRNLEGKKTTPSVVAIREGQIEVGESALNQFLTDSEHVVRLIKRAMGDRDYRFQGLSPAQISAEIVKKLKTDAEADLGVELREAVVTCPAYFGAIEVEQTQEAGERAGFEVREIVREPVAAAVYYGVENMKEGQKALITDLGGGTFDATVLELADSVFRPLATAGDRRLGGDDWTEDLLAEVARRFAAVFGEDPRNDLLTNQRLCEACEQVKRDLSQSQQAVVACSFKGRSEQVQITRNEFEELTKYRLERVVEGAENALNKVGLDWGDVDHILLVGGATRMPQVKRALQEASRKALIETGEADTMVALGAAIMAAGEVRPRKPGAIVDAGKMQPSGLVAIEVEPTAVRNLGTRAIVWEDGNPRIANSLMIPAGTALPTEQTRPDYRTSVENQEFFDVPVVEFDDVAEDIIVDTWRFNCPPQSREGAPVEVTFRYVDLSGRPDVDALFGDTGELLSKERVKYVDPDLDKLRLRMKPRYVAFALDVSGSMAGAKIAEAKRALMENARLFLEAPGSQLRVGVVTFGDTAQMICPITTDPDQVDAKVTSVHTQTTTAMAEGIDAAADLLAETPPEVQREIALVTDGMPNDPSATVEAAQRALSQGINLSVVGIGEDDVDKAFLESLTQDAFVIEGAEDLGEWLGGLLTAGGVEPEAGAITYWSEQP